VLFCIVSIYLQRHHTTCLHRSISCCTSGPEQSKSLNYSVNKTTRKSPQWSRCCTAVLCCALVCCAVLCCAVLYFPCTSARHTKADHYSLQILCMTGAGWSQRTRGHHDRGVCVNVQECNLCAQCDVLAGGLPGRSCVGPLRSMAMMSTRRRRTCSASAPSTPAYWKYWHCNAVHKRQSDDGLGVFVL
jgi:hypothetical protein